MFIITSLSQVGFQKSKLNDLARKVISRKEIIKSPAVVGQLDPSNTHSHLPNYRKTHYGPTINFNIKLSFNDVKEGLSGTNDRTGRTLGVLGRVKHHCIELPPGPTVLLPHWLAMFPSSLVSEQSGRVVRLRITCARWRNPALFNPY